MLGIDRESDPRDSESNGGGEDETELSGVGEEGGIGSESSEKCLERSMKIAEISLTGGTAHSASR